MNAKKNSLRIFFIGLALLSLQVFAQEESDLSDTLIGILSNGVSDKNTGSGFRESIDSLKNSFESPTSQSKILNSYLKSSSGWQFLKDVNFQFKAFDVDDQPDSALGFSYDYQKSIEDHELSCDTSASCVMGLDLSFSSKGNFAFDKDKNPNDFLSSSLQFDFFRSVGGSLSGPMSEQILKLDEAFANAETEEDEEAVVQELIALVKPNLTNQFYFEFGGHASLESNQRFSQKQWVYGFHTAIEVKSWSEQSAFSKFNFFDYPFALLRALSGYELCEGKFSDCFKPRGTSLPVLQLGLSRVSPENDDPRKNAGDDSDFNRIEAELSFKTPIARVGENAVYIAMNYRYFKEIDAAPAVENADLDRFDFFTITLGGDEGLFVSYTDGKLPMDFTDDRVFELGYQFQF